MSRRTKLKWGYIKILCSSFMIILIITTIYLTIYLLQSIQKLSETNTANSLMIASEFIKPQLVISNPIIPLLSSNITKPKTKQQHKKKNIKMHDLLAQYDNPFKLKKCRNAISDKHGITHNKILNKTAKCREFSGVLTIENAQRIINGSGSGKVLCPYDQRSAIRTHQLMINKVVFKNRIDKNMTWLTDIYPIYFMIAKSGSTSIFGYLQQYNRYFGYDKYGHIGHKIAVNEKINVIQSYCSFTFVREPVQRFISGYYTINALLWIKLKENFINIRNDTFIRFELPFSDRKRHRRVHFATVKGEPQRLKMFLKELQKNPYSFTRLWQIDHIQSQSEILSVYFGWLKSKLHFIGKQERIKEHWSELVGICNGFFQNNSKVIFDEKKKNKKKQLVGFGWKNPDSWYKEYDRFSDFIEYLGLEKIYEYYVNNKHKNDFDMNDILPPIWYYIDEQMYNDIVEYYYQDYQCFGYVPSYRQFVAKRDNYINIYGIQQ
eukprot:101272_1